MSTLLKDQVRDHSFVLESWKGRGLLCWVVVFRDIQCKRESHVSKKGWTTIREGWKAFYHRNKLLVTQDICDHALRNITLDDWVLNWARTFVTRLFVSQDLCDQALRNVTLDDCVLNWARTSVTKLFVSQDLCDQALRNITLDDWVLSWARTSVTRLFVSQDLCDQVHRNITLTKEVANWE